MEACQRLFQSESMQRTILYFVHKIMTVAYVWPFLLAELNVKDIY